MGRGPRRKEASRNPAEEPAEASGIWQNGVQRYSAAFESFYREQRIVPDEAWDLFMESLQSSLPTAFRIVTVTPHRHYVHKFLQETLASLQDPTSANAADGAEGRQTDFREALKALEWYKSGKEAFQLEVSRHVLRTCKPLLSFHKFLVAQSEAATIYRQEAVSMIPALFLEKEMRSDSLVLDMCAAPGSKTSQLLEALHRAAEHEKRCRRIQEKRGTEMEEDGWPALPTGAVVANDADVTRSHMLVHHLRHLHSPCLLVTSHAAQFFPTVFEPPRVQPAAAAGAPYGVSVAAESDEAAATRLSPVQFDGVLCDVPCSGDGTMRKNAALWAAWSPHQGLGCHRLQVQILLRGIKVCKVGGRIVYSTCTFNPIENEAVVHAAMTMSRGAVELEDCTEDLPALKRSPGLSSWRVEWEGRWYDSFDNVPKTARAAKKLRPSMFPPSDGSGSSPAVPLHRCMRFLPHVNNTGGFFVAVLRKVREVCLTPLSCPPSASGCSQAASLNDFPEAGGGGLKEVAYAGIQDAADACTDALAESVSEARARRPFDKMQLDMVGLDWQPEALQRQHQQLLQQEECSRSSGERPAGDPDGSGNSTAGIAAACVPASHASQRPFTGMSIAVTRDILEKALRSVLSTLDLSEDLLNPYKSKCAVREVLLRLSSLVYFRRMTSESPGASGGEPAETGDLPSEESRDRQPRRLFFVSEGVKRLVEAVGASRYKIINGGCLAFQARTKGVYRIAYGGAQWLAPFYEAVMRLTTEPAEAVAAGAATVKEQAGTLKTLLGVSAQVEGRRVFHIPGGLLYKLTATEQADRRVPLCAIEEARFGQTLVQASREGSLLLLARLPHHAPEAAGSTFSNVAVPAWRGRTNVELMLDPNTRWALKCLLNACGFGHETSICDKA
ncbi:uncharacterized protein LOC34623416 [Cyclospora cayetanensis]|uniref:Uncharacterized protein LOC34623416 n=1 Tax=Cyclospora cayetanensis TaxID=88456 RepID=A0A6P6RVY1_9EIME|nr:uncharacterized protein LOC34623416 [Cyclospora cayetanensis]